MQLHKINCITITKTKKKQTWICCVYLTLRVIENVIVNKIVRNEGKRETKRLKKQGKQEKREFSRTLLMDFECYYGQSNANGFKLDILLQIETDSSASNTTETTLN